MEIRDRFCNHFNNNAKVVSRSPGRINLIGEHTDYNGGWVLPAAIDRYMYFGISGNASSRCTIYAADLEAEFTFDISNFSKTDHLWQNYFLGVITEIQALGKKLSGFDCYFYSDIPIGSGLSSSAALECGFIKALDGLFDLSLSNWDIVNLGHRSENNFLEINSGILDQFACTFGKEDHAIKLNCDTRIFEKIPCQIDGYEWVLFNSNVKHTHLTSGYNDRVQECERALSVLQLQYPEIANLSSASYAQLETVKVKLSEIEYARAYYIIGENDRLNQFIEALEKQNIRQLGKLLYQTHYGLSSEYAVSCEELDFLVECTRRSENIIGARMMGGGFGGCTLNLIRRESKDQVIDEVSKQYLDRFGVELDVYAVVVSDGVQLLS